MYCIMWLSPNTPMMLHDQQVHAESGYALNARTLMAELSAETSDFNEVCNISAVFWLTSRSTKRHRGWMDWLYSKQLMNRQAELAVVFMEH